MTEAKQNTDDAAGDPAEEELVAYLDGELDDAESQRIERRLGEDPHYRSRLQGMQQTWDLLDLLPRAHLDQSFTKSTIEMVALKATAETKRGAAWRTRAALAWGGGAACLVVAGLLGYSATRAWLTSADRQLVRDLPVIENMDLYYHIDDIEFLRDLDQEGLFAEGENKEDAI